MSLKYVFNININYYILIIYTHTFGDFDCCFVSFFNSFSDDINGTTCTLKYVSRIMTSILAVHVFM